MGCIQMHLRENYAVCISVYLLVDMGVVVRDIMEEDQARTGLINVSDGLWHWAALRRLSVSRSASQAAQ